MKILIDVNLSPSWVEIFKEAGWTATHWTNIADPRASDPVIMEWARSNGYVVFTNDLDFGALLAMTAADGPSVVQVRGLRLAPRDLGDLMVRALQQNEEALSQGALMILNETHSRVRILPIARIGH